MHSPVSLPLGCLNHNYMFNFFPIERKNIEKSFELSRSYFMKWNFAIYKITRGILIEGM